MLRHLFVALPISVLVAGSSVAADLPVMSNPEEPIEEMFASYPAVSEINAKFDIRGGVVNSDASFISTGAVSVPLGHAFGVQLDGIGGTADDWFVGTAGHLFWRDPAVGLLGFYGSWTHFNGAVVDDVTRVSAEGELYWGNNINLSAIAGWEFADNYDGFFDIVDVNYFPTEDLRLYVGHRYSEIGHRGVLGAEYLLPLDFPTGVALFAEGRFGENDYRAAWGGVRLYFGPNKTLIRRHREDDPRVRIPDWPGSPSTPVSLPPVEDEVEPE